MGYNLCGHKESDMTEHTHTHNSFQATMNPVQNLKCLLSGPLQGDFLTF